MSVVEEVNWSFRKAIDKVTAPSVDAEAWTTGKAKVWVPVWEYSPWRRTRGMTDAAMYAAMAVAERVNG